VLRKQHIIAFTRSLCIVAASCWQAILLLIDNVLSTVVCGTRCVEWRKAVVKATLSAGQAPTGLAASAWLTRCVCCVMCMCYICVHMCFEAGRLLLLVWKPAFGGSSVAEWIRTPSTAQCWHASSCCRAVRWFGWLWFQLLLVSLVPGWSPRVLGWRPHQDLHVVRLGCLTGVTPMHALSWLTPGGERYCRRFCTVIA
jgi:hypothetical protein